MSVNSYNQYVKLSDALERELMREALSCGEPVSVIDLTKSLAKGLKAVVHVIARTLSDATRPLGNAHVQSSAR